MNKCSCGYVFNSPADYRLKDIVSVDNTTDGKEILVEELFYCPMCKKESLALNVYEFKSMTIEV